MRSSDFIAWLNGAHTGDECVYAKGSGHRDPFLFRSVRTAYNRGAVRMHVRLAPNERDPMEHIAIVREVSDKVKEERERIIAAYLDKGLDIKTISRDFDRTPSFVRAVLWEAGLSTRPDAGEEEASK